jgi:predicted permease
MFDNAMIIASQVFILFLLIGVGFWARKSKLIDDAGVRQMTQLLLVVVTPFMIIKAFQMPFDPALLRGLLIALISAVLSHVLGIVTGFVFFRSQEPARRKVLRFGMIFSNSAFMCIPLLQALLGSRGVFYGSVYIAVFYLLQWTYGVVLMTGNRADVNLRQALVNPGTIGIVIGLGLFLAGIQLPTVPAAVIGHLANLNTPIAMLVIGGTLATSDLSGLWRDRAIFGATAIRLLLIPAAVLVILLPFKLEYELLAACLIPASAPVAAACALFATRYDQDAALASHLVALSTLLSIVTMPAIIILGQMSL